MKLSCSLTLLIVVFFGSNVCLGADGVSATEVLLGQSCALDGPAKSLGTGMRDGLVAYFNTVNAKGGVKGKKIRLISVDDGYEPEKAIANARKLIEQDKVFLLIGEVGTPTSMAVVPLAEEAKVPFLAPFTGAEFLRNPFKKFVINIRGSYYQEMEKLAEFLVDKKGLKKIACFYQNDGYGQAGLTGIELALEKRSMKLVAKGFYERNTSAIKSGLMDIRSSAPEAIVMVGAYQPCAEFIKVAKEKLKMTDVLYCNISFVGTEALVKQMGAAGEGVIISQVVNYPWDKSIPLVKEYHAAMDEYRKNTPDTEVGFVSLEGFMAAKLFCQVLEKLPGEIGREEFIATISSVGTFDIGGVELKFGSNDHQGMDQVFLTTVKNGKVEPLN